MSREHIPDQSQRWQQTQEFFRVAVAEGAHINPPKRSELNSSRWAETRNMLGAYLYTPFTLNDIGTRYQISRECVRRRVKNGCRDIHSQCSADTQERYPLSEIILTKPVQLPSRER